MKLNAGESLKMIFRKLGIKNPEQYDGVLDELKAEFEEEIEGDLKQRIEGLKSVEDFKKDKGVRNQIKAEFLNGLEQEGLGEFVKALDDIDQAEYARKDGATNKVKHLIEATVKAKIKQVPNNNNKAEEDALRKKVLEIEQSIANGDYVPKSQIESLTSKINLLHEGGFKDKILSKLSPKVVDHMNDPDLLNIKISKYMKEGSLSFNHEDGRFYKETSEGVIPATKNEKTVDLMDFDDLVIGVLASDEKLVKKSDTTPTGEIVVTVPKVIANDGVSQAVHDKAQQHLKQMGKVA